jgi:2-octaprenylphenol hydroxylase
LGVWSQVSNQRAGRFDEMQVWVEDGTGRIDFSATELDLPCLGEVVENRVLVSALYKQFCRSDCCTVLSGNAVTSIESQSTDDADRSIPSSQLLLADGQQISADLVVAADGARSRVRELIDMPVRQWDYGHDAIVCNVQMQRSHQHRAIQRFTQFGPVAFLPLGLSDSDQKNNPDWADRLCTVVWSQTRTRAEELAALDDKQFSLALAASIEGRLGSVEKLSSRASFPLRQLHAKDYLKDGVVLIADAAHTVHPLAGQGINLGLMDVAALSCAIEESLEANSCVASRKFLRRFQRQRKTANLSMMAAIEAFKRVYQPLPLPLTLLRNRAMSLLDQHTLIKQQMMRYALGPEYSV